MLVDSSPTVLTNCLPQKDFRCGHASAARSDGEVNPSTWGAATVAWNNIIRTCVKGGLSGLDYAAPARPNRRSRLPQRLGFQLITPPPNLHFPAACLRSIANRAHNGLRHNRGGFG